MKLPSSLFWGQLGRHALVGSILAGLIVVSKMFFDPGSLIALTIVGGLSCIIAWLLSGAISCRERSCDVWQVCPRDGSALLTRNSSRPLRSN